MPNDAPPTRMPSDAEAALTGARATGAEMTAPSTGGGSQTVRLDAWPGHATIAAGYFDLFGVNLEDGAPSGGHFHVLRLEIGQTLHALPESIAAELGRTLLAVGSLEARLVSSGAAPDPGGVRATSESRWLEVLLEALCGPAPPWPDQVATGENALELAAGGKVYAAANTIWLRHEAGEVRCSVNDLEVPCGTIVPMCAGLALEAKAASRLVPVSPSELAEPEARLFDLGYRIVLAALGQAMQRSAFGDLERLEGRRAANQKGMSAAMRHLGGLATARLAARPPVESGTARARAVTRIVEALGVEVPAEALVGLAPDATLSVLARAAGIDLRRVALRAHWWLRDNGPLLGLRRADGVPLVLLPHTELLSGRFHYLLIDPETGSESVVDSAAAATLAGEAVMPYRRLPARLRGAIDLAQFALKGSTQDLLTVVAMGLFSGLLATAIPLATGLVFNDIVARTDVGQLPVLILGLAMVALGMLSCDVARAIAVVRVEGRMGANLQPAIMRHLMALPVAALRGQGKGDLTARVLGVQRIMKLISGTTIESILAGIFSVTSLGVIVFYSRILAAVALGLVIVAGLTSLLLARLQLGHERVAARVRGTEDGLFVQATEAIAKIRTTQSEARFFALWADLFGRHKMALFRAHRVANAREAFLNAYSVVAYMVLFLLASRLLAHGAGDRASALSLGDFLAVYAAFGQLLAAGLGLSNGMAAALEAVPQFERLRSIIQAVPETSGLKTDPGRIDGPIEVTHASFRYAEDAPLVLDDVSLNFEPGRFTAIVGASGSGKSTLSRLLLGLETAQGGDILFQGQSISTLDLGALRRRIGVVLQNGRLMSGSLYDNITGGLPFSLDEAWAAARLAGLADDIEAMPMGMHTVVIEGISGLSGGQTQRVLLARALIGKPDVLLLDEATSALDNATQAVVTASLQQLRATRIVIAHRLSTIRHADRIHVLQQGRIVESGDFETLVAQGGVFSALARRQM